MADQYCPSCGTEVDADARFCPSCGQTLDLPTDSPEQLDLPPAPGWPEPAAVPQRPADEASADEASADEASADEAEAEASGAEDEEPTRPAQHTPPAAAPPEPGPEPERGPAAEPGPPVAQAQPSPGGAMAPSPSVELPFSWPATMSGWLIGVGSVVGAAALIPTLGDLLSVFLFLALLGVAATVFLPDRMPDIPRLRLIILAVTMVGLGVALDRAAFTVRGVETVLLIAMLAAAGGALLIELDRDRPLAPPGQSRG